MNSTSSSFNADPEWLKEAGQSRERILFADNQFLVLVRYVAFDVTLKQTNCVSICKEEMPSVATL